MNSPDATELVLSSIAIFIIENTSLFFSWNSTVDTMIAFLKRSSLET